MAFSKTSASSRDDVCAQFAAFAVANAGFVDEAPIVVSGYTMQRLSKGGIYFYLLPTASGNNIALAMSYQKVAFFPGVNNGAQELPTLMTLWAFPGPYSNLYLYSDGISVFAVVEATNGIFNHMAIGKITKTENFVGGEFVQGGYYYNGTTNNGIFTYYGPFDNQNGPYFAGGNNTHSSNATGFIRAVPASGQLNDYRDFAAMSYFRNNQMAQGMVSVYGWIAPLMRDAPNAATLRTPMYPMYIAIRNPASGLFRISGYVEGIRVVPMKYTDPSEIIYTDWQAFPLTQKDGSSLSCPDSGNWGLAYKRAP